MSREGPAVNKQGRAMHACMQYNARAKAQGPRLSSSALTWMDEERRGEERPGSSGLHAQRTGSWAPRPGPVLSKDPPQAGAARAACTMRTGRERERADGGRKEENAIGHTATCTSIIRPS